MPSPDDIFLPDDPARPGLLADFRAFYGQVLRLRHEIDAACGRLPATEPPDAELHAQPPPDAEIVVRQLQAVLQRQLAREDASEAGARREACYAMAALADDIFLHEVDWPGRDMWRDMLLEYRLFQTHAAGEEIFARIEALLRAGRPGQRELARLYLLVLQQGFRGGLRAAADPQRLQDYARRLYEFVYQRAPDPFRDGHVPFAQALAHTLTGPALPPRGLVSNGVWLGAAAMVAVLLASELVWLNASSGIAAAAASVLRAAGAGP